MGECKSGQEGLKDQEVLELCSFEDIAALPPQLNGASDSLLQRIDHLDNILTEMEDKAPTEPNSSPSTSPRPTSRPHCSEPTAPLGLERRRKPTETVLEEVQEKGTLVERISDLEKRVMKLHRMLSLKSNENVAYPSGFHIPGIAHRRAMSHQETHNQQSFEEPIDVEKHEVTRSHSDYLGRKNHIEPFVDSSSHDTHSTTSESPHVRQYEEKMSSGAEQDPRCSAQPSKKKKLRIRKWLSKRLHIHLPGSSPQDRNHCASIGRCWGPKIHPKNCCNVRKKDMNTTPYTH
ncbi:hypothetical protein GOP47_0016617 [Adiantum capillus-veneris]|uniref:Uncharacterized protein n=1 Tax=Adiantum capillus-veneris TaxID=13818 RepID=A0A9D4ZBW4_ADICA|nr:hypothetical protein GOP47_0016617 [Adiantum capillus-veneris]